MKRRRGSIDEVVLAGLSHEFDPSDTAATDTKIRRSLRYYGFEVERGMLRVPTLRVLKNRLLDELSHPNESIYYVRTADKRGFAALEDFDSMRLSEDLRELFPSVRPWLVAAFVHQAIYLYYLR